MENPGNSWKITYKWGGFPLPRLIAGEYVHIVAILVDYMGVSPFRESHIIANRR